MLPDMVPALRSISRGSKSAYRYGMRFVLYSSQFYFTPVPAVGVTTFHVFHFSSIVLLSNFLPFFYADSDFLNGRSLCQGPSICRCHVFLIYGSYPAILS